MEENVPAVAVLTDKLTPASASSYSTPENLYHPTPNSETSQEVEERTPFEQELLSHLPKKELVDDLVSFYFSATDVCQTTFKASFYQSYNKLWQTPADHHVNVPFLGVLFISMANAIHCHPDSEGPNAEKSQRAMELYDRLSNQITEDPRYNFHIETVEATLLQSMFLLNNVSKHQSLLI